MDLLGIFARMMLSLTPVTQAGAVPATQPAVTAPARTALSADAAVDEVQKFYANIQQVTAVFRQSVTYDTFGTTKTSDGSLYIQKPGKMRWDYVEKKKGKVVTKKSFISNGQYLYMVEHDNKQVVKKNLANDLMPVAVSFLYGKGDLKSEFTPSLDTSGKYGTKEDIVLKLVPKKPSAQYKSLTLVVSPKDFHVTQSIIVDSSNNVNQFRFFTPDFKKPIKETWFQFDERSVPDYHVVNADNEGRSVLGPSMSTPPPPPKK